MNKERLIRTSQTERLLNILRDGQRHTVPELIRRVYGLNKPSSARLGARIYNLKQKGYKIESGVLKAPIWWYRMDIKHGYKTI